MDIFIPSEYANQNNKQEPSKIISSWLNNLVPLPTGTRWEVTIYDESYQDSHMLVTDGRHVFHKVSVGMKFRKWWADAYANGAYDDLAFNIPDMYLVLSGISQ